MTLYFAYGSNMSRTLMRLLCPGAEALGRARLQGWRFRITSRGYASIASKPGSVVHGVLWRLSPRDRAVLDAYEDVDSGFYRRRMLPVRYGARNVSALVYVGHDRGEGWPNPAYQKIVLGAASDWKLPQRYVREIARRLPYRSGRAENTRERA